MIFYISHWYKSPLPVDSFLHGFIFRENEGTKKYPNWIEKINTLTAINIDDNKILEFIQKSGPAIVKPPTENFNYWSIILTDGSAKFSQK